ncbi:MAG: glutaredoxin [Tissierellia bacterium]|nr:glutaredoxin [Tissierellia bacterium]
MAEHVLYYKKLCPYCVKVLRMMEKNNLDFEKRNIDTNPEYREELERVGGSAQVPCLFIDGKPMYESADIIEYLKENLVK